MRARAWVVLALLCALPWGGGVAFADPNPVYAPDTVKAAFIYRFTGYVDWPQESPQRPEFVVAVLGDDAMAAELERLLQGRTIQNLPAVVHRIRTLMALGHANVLYVGAGQAGAARAGIMALAAPVLVITDEERGLASGSAINFLTVDRRIRFEVSLPAAAKAGLRISSDMLSVALNVQGSQATTP